MKLFASASAYAVIISNVCSLVSKRVDANKRITVLDKVKSINCGILELSDAVIIKFLLFGDNSLSVPSNTLILNSIIYFIIFTERLDLSILTH